MGPKRWRVYPCSVSASRVPAVAAVLSVVAWLRPHRPLLLAVPSSFCGDEQGMFTDLRAYAHIPWTRRGNGSGPEMVNSIIEWVFPCDPLCPGEMRSLSGGGSFRCRSPCPHHREGFDPCAMGGHPLSSLPADVHVGVARSDKRVSATLSSKRAWPRLHMTSASSESQGAASGTDVR